MGKLTPKKLCVSATYNRAMPLSQYLQWIFRDSRGARGRLLFFVACLAVGVAAVVAVAGLMQSMEEGIRIEARRLLGADVAIEARRPMPAALDDLLKQYSQNSGRAIQRTNTVELVTLIASRPPPNEQAQENQSSLLVELKSAKGEFPLYGSLALVPDAPLAQTLNDSSAIVASEVLTRLNLSVGSTISIGNAQFLIVGVVSDEPDKLNFSFSLGPRVFVTSGGLEQTGLITKGSRLRHAALLKIEGGATSKQADELAKFLKDRLPDATYFNVESFGEAQPALRAGMRRMGNYLGLVGLLSLLIGGVGVAQTVRAYVASRLDSIAIMKCLGVTPNQVAMIYLGQVLALAIVASIAGSLVGAAIQVAIPRIAPELIPPELVHAWQPAAIARGLLMGVSVALVFSVPPLLEVRRVPPVRLLRTDSQPLPPGKWVNAAAAALLLGAVFFSAAIQGGSAKYGLFFTLGLSVVLLILAGAAMLVIKIVTRIPRDWGRLWLRHGLASLARPGSATISAIVALGLGVGIISSIHFVQRRLAIELSGDLPVNAPTSFFVDIQPDQHEGLKSMLENMDAERFNSVPIVMGRLQNVDGASVEELAKAMAEDKPEARQKKWVLTREQRMTYGPSLPVGNTIIAPGDAGEQLWRDPSKNEVSIERQFADDLGVHVGSTLTIDVQGIPIELTVSTIRNINWRTFGINFFLVVEPGVLEDAPQLRLATSRLPEGKEQKIQDAIVAKYPNVTVVHIRKILMKVLTVLERLGFAVELLGAFTVIAGVVILAGVISASYSQRGREVALLKTLGMTRRQVVMLMAVEYALVGLVAASIGIAAGGALAWVILTRVMEVEFGGSLISAGAILAGATLAAVTAGLAVSWRALQTRPIAVLRQM